MKTPPFSDYPIVKGKAVSLRQILPSDLEEIVEVSFYDGVQAKTVEDALAMNDRIHADYEAGNSIHWGIIENQSGKIAGTCGYYRGFDGRKGELGCVLLPQFRGKGLMTAALKLAIHYGRNELELMHIWAVTHQTNTKAIQLLERLDFKKIRDLEDNDIEFDLPFDHQNGEIA